MEKFFHSDIRGDAFEEFLRGDWLLFDCRIDGSASQAVTLASGVPIPRTISWRYAAMHRQ